jgi:hypothetical protein
MLNSPAKITTKFGLAFINRRFLLSRAEGVERGAKSEELGAKRIKRLKFKV